MLKTKTINKPKGTFYSDFVIKEGILYCVFEKVDDRVVTKKIGRVKHNYIKDFIENKESITLKY
jgi:hypothetical protein